VTGSPLAHRFRFPPAADYIKLPSVRKVAAGRYESRYLGLSFAAVRDLRRDILLGAARHFRPRLLVVDNVPRGLKGELAPTLDYLQTTDCRLVLGLRDVVDEPQWVRATWAEDESYEALDRVYDRILVYGEQEIYDLVAEYAFSREAAEKTRFVGYLGREPPRRPRDEIRAALGVGDAPLILAMAGGGEDGHELLSTVAAAIEISSDRSSCEWLLLGGPLMPPHHRRELMMRAARVGCGYVEFLDDVASYVDAADVVVAMGGYNSVCELLSLGKRALIVPRITPRREQAIRARALSGRGFLRMLEREQLEPERLLAEVDALLAASPDVPSLPMKGLPRAADALDELLTPRRLVATRGR
jgi:predicted glycosyltransferase